MYKTQHVNKQPNNEQPMPSDIGLAVKTNIKAGDNGYGPYDWRNATPWQPYSEWDVQARYWGTDYEDDYWGDDY